MSSFSCQCGEFANAVLWNFPWQNRKALVAAAKNIDNVPVMKKAALVVTVYLHSSISNYTLISLIFAQRK